MSDDRPASGVRAMIEGEREAQIKRQMRFAASVAAMQGLLARGADFIDPKGARNAKAVAAEWSVEYADALLAELDRTTNKNEAKRE